MRCQHCGEPSARELTPCGQNLENLTGEKTSCPLRTCEKCMTMTGMERHELRRIILAGKRMLLQTPRPQREQFDNDAAFETANREYNEVVVPLWHTYEKLERINTGR